MIKQSIYNLSLYFFSKNYYLLSYILFYSKNYAKKYLNIFFYKYITNDFIVCKQKSSNKLFKSEITSWMSRGSQSCYCNTLKSSQLERTRGAGAPEVLRRETTEEEFRLRRNKPLNMAPSAPKARYCQADFLAQLFQQKNVFLGPGKRFLFRQVLVIFGTLFGTPLLHCLLDGMKPGPRIFEDLDVFRGQTHKQTHKRAQVI